MGNREGWELRGALVALTVSVHTVLDGQPFCLRARPTLWLTGCFFFNLNSVYTVVFPWKMHLLMHPCFLFSWLFLQDFFFFLTFWYYVSCNSCQVIQTKTQVNNFMLLLIEKPLKQVCLLPWILFMSFISPQSSNCMMRDSFSSSELHWQLTGQASTCAETVWFLLSRAPVYLYQAFKSILCCYKEYGKF